MYEVSAARLEIESRKGIVKTYSGPCLTAF